MRVVDRLIEHPDFKSVVSLIRHSVFVAGVEYVRSTLASVGPEDLVVSTPPPLWSCCEYKSGSFIICQHGSRFASRVRRFGHPRDSRALCLFRL